MSSERTEAPTPKKLKQAKDRGQVSKSQDLVTTGALLGAVAILRMKGPDFWSDMMEIMRGGLERHVDSELTIPATMSLTRSVGTEMLMALLPLFAMLAIAGIVANVGQTGFVISKSALTPKFSHVNPAKGAKRLVGPEGWMNMAKQLAKMTVITVVVWMTLRSQMAAITTMGLESPALAAAHFGKLGFDIALRAAITLFLLAILDFAWQKKRFMGQMRMTKEEVKQEMKESDGDPQMKAAIRRKRNQMQSRMMAAVPTADVVVMNPTHYAVALKYDPVTMAAPIVVAKGEALMALRIKEEAKRHRVPILEEPPLARALYAAVQVGHPIPANLFHAVAEVLAWVYALKTKAPGVRRPSPMGASL